ncbi:MAG: glycosyl hydrolase family 28-related protein [Puniceicoccaceae bacterium]
MKLLNSLILGNLLPCFVFLLHAVEPIHATESIYPSGFQDPQALDLRTYSDAAIHSGDDITQILQQAIDTVAERGTFGIILIPQGDYLLTDTVHVWKGIRLIGYGSTRPVFRLPSHTTGFSGASPRYLLHYASDKPKPGAAFRDANPGTFYSALSNIDFMIEPGNPAAVAVRSHWAQHSFISHVRFTLSDALAGIDEVGNLVHDCEFIGGQYGIMTTKPSPSWPFVLLDSHFQEQQIASILTEEAGMCVVRCHFEQSPFAVVVREQRSEELVMEACSFASIHEAITCISEPDNARSQVNLLQCLAQWTPTIARFRDKRAPVTAPDSAHYQIELFSHGLHIGPQTTLPSMQTQLRAVPLPNLPLPLHRPERKLPPNNEWINVQSLGAIGDGNFDNTKILQAAVREHEVLYFPSGRYRISDTLTLAPNSCLVGLSPITTQILITDETPAFHPAGPPKAVIESAEGGDNILQGIGIDAGAINHRAVALKWTGSSRSLVSDVRFLGGHGTYDTDGKYLQIYNNNRSADADVRRRWDRMPASLWITEDGGGTFRNLWTASPFAHAGMLIEQTSTPGWVYQISSEHHLRNEIMISDVQNWKFYALQFEEEMWEGRDTLALRIEQSKNLSFHNTWIYRVMRTFTPYPFGITVRDSQNLHFHGIHAYGPSKFTVDDTLRILDTGAGVRSREVAWLHIEDSATMQTPCDGLNYELLASGFNHIDSPEVDASGNLYFVDEKHQHVWRWNHQRSRTERVLDLPIEPSQLILEDEHHLIILTRTGKVYRKDLSTGNGYHGLESIPPTDASTGFQQLVIPTTRWRDSHDFLEVVSSRKPHFFEFGEFALPAEASFVNAGILTTWFHTVDLQRTYDLQSVSPRTHTYVSDEFAQKTWRFTVREDGTLDSPSLFAEEGESGVIELPGTDRVLIAAGHLFVYDQNGRLLQTLTPPHRPTAIAVGPSVDGVHYLYVLARQHLYRTTLPLQ